MPTGNGENKDDQEVEETPEPDIQPVGQDYIEEIKSDDGKVSPALSSLILFTIYKVI